MIAVFVLVALAVVGALGGVHRYLWCRLVRDVSAPGSWWRRTGTILLWVLPFTPVAAMAVGRADGPFTLEQILSWPAFLWLALLLYLTLALLVGELVRPLLRKYLAHRDARASAAGAGADTGAEATAEAMAAGERPDPQAGRPAMPATSAGTARPESTERTVGHAAAADGGGTALATEEAGREGTAEREASSTGRSGTGEHGTGDSSAAPAGEPAQSGHPVSRRLFVARTVAAGAAAVAVGTVGAGAYSVLNGPSTKRVTVPLAKLPRSAHGYRIAVVSDVHLGPILGRGHTQRVVDTVNATQPDMVAIVGDLVDGTVDNLAPAVEPLRGLASRHGTFFVTGNHEYFVEPDAWIDHLREIGVHPLENERRELPGFDLAGVNDLAGEQEGEGPDFQQALGDRDTSRASVLLAHQPVQIHDAVDHGVGLQLSGHTHGGQLWPGPYLAGLANPTVAGLERYGDTQLYVTRGAGAWGPPVRVGAESDITVVTLASRQA